MKTKKDLEERVAYLEKENTLLLLGFHDTMTKALTKVGHWSNHKGQRYQWHISRIDGAAGGLWYETFYCAGQHPTTHVVYFEDLLQVRKRYTDNPEFDASYHNAVGKAIVLRNKATS